MAKSARIRRRARRKAPPLRRIPDARTAAARDQASGLIVGGARDPAERSADRMAARVLSGGPVTAGSAPAATIRRKCAGCEEEEKKDKTAKRAPAPGAALAHGTSSTPAPKAAAEAVNSMGPGRGLSAGERGYFEPRFGQDFSAVRIHEGPKADRATDALQARAFAHGPDLAFAAGERSTATMAHELAHVAQGGGPVRRVVKAKKDPKINLMTPLHDSYKVGEGTTCAMTESAGSYFCPARKDSGKLEHQIAQNLVASERTFTVAGASQDTVLDNFDAQVSARLNIIDFAKSFRTEFKTGTPEISPKYLDMTLTEVTRRTNAITADMKAKGKTDVEIKAYFDTRPTDMIFEVFADIAGTPEFENIMREFRKKGEAFDKKKAAGGDPAYDFKMACQFATMTVMYGASRSPITQQNIKGPGVTKVEPTAAAWTDWVPGDWGYVRNTGTTTPSAGLEGENIISIGDSKFWAHFNPKTPIQDLATLFAMVKSWNASAELTTTRRFPTAGLLP
jgi:Domain of unknown function (DUF4157)